MMASGWIATTGFKTCCSAPIPQVQSSGVYSVFNGCPAEAKTRKSALKNTSDHFPVSVGITLLAEASISLTEARATEKDCKEILRNTIILFLLCVLDLVLFALLS